MAGAKRRKGITRREFVKAAAAGTIALGVAPNIFLPTQSRAAARELKILVWSHFDRGDRANTGYLRSSISTIESQMERSLEAYQRKPKPPDWPRPSSLVSRQVDNLTGLLANPGCPASDAYFEWFIPGTEPVAECPPRLSGERPTPVRDTRPSRKPPSTAPARKP